jgi:cytochrome c oxidase subunit 1
MTGRMLNQTLGKIHFWWMFIAFNLAFMPLFAAGLLDMPRRASTYAASLQALNDWVSTWAFLLFGSMVLFAINIIWSWFFTFKVAPADPWHARSIEWLLPTPLGRRNFETIPVFTTGPYDYGNPSPKPVADLGGPPDPGDKGRLGGLGVEPAPS